MEKMYVKMLKDFGKEHKQNEVYEMDVETAKSWIDAGLAEENKPQEDLATKFSKALEERDEALLKAIKDMAKVESKVPSVRIVESEEDKTKCLGEMIQLVVKAQDHKGVHCDDKGRVEAKEKLAKIYKSTMQVGDGVLGGYTVPTQYVNDLIEMPSIPSFFLDRVTRVPVTSEGEVELPALNQSITPDGSGQTAAGAGAKVLWKSELDDSPETNFEFRMVRFKPDRLAGFVPLSNHLLRSSSQAVQNITNTLLVQQTKGRQEYACLLGDGVGKPLGCLESPSALASDRATNNLISYVDVKKMLGKMHPALRAGAVWAYSISAEEQILSLEDTNGDAVFHPMAQNGPDMKLFGIPMVPCEFLPALGSDKDLILVNPSMYYVVEALQPTISVSEHVRFYKDQTVIKIETWFGGQPGFNHAITLGDGTTQVSSAVYLEA